MSDTPIADMVEQMLSAGIPPEIIVLAVRTTERTMAEATRGRGPVDPAAERRRAWDRDRKARQAAERAGNSTGTVKSPPSSSEVLITDESIKERKSESGIPVESSPRQKRAAGHGLPADWKPNDAHLTLAQSLGRDRPWVVSQWGSMRDWADANKHRAVARKSDWNATFSGWMRREAAARGGGRQPQSAAASFFGEAMGGARGEE